MKEFIRKCPICGQIINYTNKYNCQNAEKKNTKCKSCAIKLIMTDERKEQMKLRVIGNKNPMFGKHGNQNPFYGKKHTKESKSKMIVNRDYSSYKTEEFRKKISYLNSGDKNPMFGKTVYSIWIEKYGEDIANERMNELRLKQSLNSSGKNNPMFGKPSPNGSGNGWSGWYKNWFFRSVKELSYMINVIERYNMEWVSAESNNYKINYNDYKNSDRTYTADFIVNNKYMVEIKPKKLWSSDGVLRKKEAAIKFCNQNNLIYKLRDVPNLSFETILDLYNQKIIIFTEKYNEKFIKKITEN